MGDISGRNGDGGSRYSVRVAATASSASYFVNILPSQALPCVGSFEILYDLFCPFKNQPAEPSRILKTNWLYGFVIFNVRYCLVGTLFFTVYWCKLFDLFKFMDNGYQLWEDSRNYRLYNTACQGVKSLQLIEENIYKKSYEGLDLVLHCS